MSGIEENFAYLRDVLGIKYLSHPVASPVPLVIQEVPSPQTLDDLQRSLGDCTLCKLSRGRKTVVFGSGSHTASLMFVGEGPGEQEDLQGLPFVGPAGQLLTKMITAMGINRDDVYIANVVKCRPPQNRNPEPDEIATCSPFLKKQIEMINPRIIVALGSFAAQMLLSTEERISKLRGTVHSYEGRKLVATFHPSYLLRNPAEKKSAWADLQLVMKELETFKI
jgi:uracil-DNA glycosylase family 4